MRKISQTNKICIYLDQFVVSNLISESTTSWKEIKKLLEHNYLKNNIYCPLSLEHIMETAKKDLLNATIHDEYFRKLSDNYFFKNDPFLTSQLISSLIRNNKYTLNTFLESKKIKQMEDIYSFIEKKNQIFDESIKSKMSFQNDLRKNLSQRINKKTEDQMFNAIKKMKVQSFLKRLKEYTDNKSIIIRGDDYGVHKFPNWIDQILYLLTYKHQFKEKQFQQLFNELHTNGFNRIPTLDIKFSLGAHLAVKNKQERTGDHIDLMRISSSLFSTDIFFTDKKRKFEICELQLDEKYNTKVFSGTDSDLLEFKKYIETL